MRKAEPGHARREGAPFARAARLGRYLVREALVQRTAEEAAREENLQGLEDLRTAVEHARQARSRHAQIGSEAARLNRMAERAVRQVADARRREDSARKLRARRIEQLQAAEEAEQRADARRMEAIEQATRYAQLAAEAAQRVEHARVAEEMAWDEVVRNQRMIQPEEAPLSSDGFLLNESGRCWECGSALQGRQRKWCSSSCRTRATRRSQSRRSTLSADGDR